MYVAGGTHRVTKEHRPSLYLEFHWATDRHLNGLFVEVTRVVTLFGLEVPDNVTGLLKRPRLLGAAIERDSGSPALDGMVKGEDIRFQLIWPDTPLIDWTPGSADQHALQRAREDVHKNEKSSRGPIT